MQRLEPILLRKRHVIWDWNGTLLNDLDFSLKVTAEVMREHGLEPVDKARYQEIFGFPVRDYCVRLGYDFNRIPFEAVAKGFMDRFIAGLGGCQLHPGVQELLSNLNRHGLVQSVLSASDHDHLMEVLEKFEVRHHFRHIFGIQGHQADSKLASGRRLMETSGIPAGDTILVGDTDHDLEVGRELGVEVLLLAHGHQSFERLKKKHPHVLEMEG